MFDADDSEHQAFRAEVAALAETHEPSSEGFRGRFVALIHAHTSESDRSLTSLSDEMTAQLGWDEANRLWQSWCNEYDTIHEESHPAPTLRELVDALPGAPSWPGSPFIADPGWTEVARYPATVEEASEVVVYVQRMPAKFFKIESAALVAPLTTGSVEPEFVESIAKAIAGGMLGSEAGE